MDDRLLWIALGLAATLCVLGSLKTLATAMKHEIGLHDLKVEAWKIRRQYLERLKAAEDEAKAAPFAQFVSTRLEPARKAA